MSHEFNDVTIVIVTIMGNIEIFHCTYNYNCIIIINRSKCTVYYYYSIIIVCMTSYQY